MTSPLPRAVEALRALAHAGGAAAAAPPVPPWDLARERLVATWALPALELDLLTLAVLPELHEGWGDLLASLQGGDRRPSLGLALRVLVPDPAPRARAAVRLGSSALLRAGMVRLDGSDRPEPDRLLRPSRVITAFLRGDRPDTLEDAGPVRRVGTEDGRLLLAARPSLQATVARLTRGAEPWVVRLRRCEPDDLELARAIAAHLGRGLVRIRDAGPGPESVQDAALLAALGTEVVWLEGRPDVRLWALDPGPPRGVLLLAPPQGASVEVGDAVPLRAFGPPRPTPPEVATLWQHLVPELDGRTLDPLANQTRLGLAEMRRAVIAGRAEAEAAGEPVTVELLHRALVEGDDAAAVEPAVVSHPRVAWDALVVPEPIQEQFDELRARVAHRVTVHHRWGMGGEGGDGVIAVLHGDFGVGKSFAAEVLASAFALPLVRLDLGRIGQPTGIVDTVLAEADGFRRVVLFDGAESVLARRLAATQLLQRLESFDGVVILSTSRLDATDELLLRRVPLVIHLPRPTAALRRRLWERAIPDAARGDDLDLAGLATRFDLVGGEIRSAALRAAYGAAAGGGRITQADAATAIRLEYARRGRPFPEAG